ncbi:MAG: hypothetical protein LC754_17405 [Acidobacteria bacterium]|nr:hypothetical protein [Acidobacteriota bacterium]
MSFIKRRQIIKWVAAALVSLGAALCASAQNKVSVRPENKGGHPSSTTTPAFKTANAEKDAAQYFYEFKQPDFFVNHIQINHDAAGRGSITFERKDDVEAITEPFEFSQAALRRVNALWVALNFLDAETNFDTGNKKVAYIGTTRLRVLRDGRERATEFIYSSNRDAFQLADEYRRAADQAVLVFELAVARESQPLITPKLLERLDILVRRNALSDAQQLVPLLRDLSTDERLPLIARNHVGRILKKIVK